MNDLLDDDYIQRHLLRKQKEEDDTWQRMLSEAGYVDPPLFPEFLQAPPQKLTQSPPEMPLASSHEKTEYSAIPPLEGAKHEPQVYMKGKEVLGQASGTGAEMNPGLKALDLLSDGVPIEKINREWGVEAGINVPIYDIIDLAVDMSSGGFYPAGRMIYKGLFTGAKGAVKAAAAETARQAGFGILAGSWMAAADEVTGNAAVTALSGLVGPVMTAGLMTLSRQSLVKYLRHLEAKNPKLADEIWDASKTVLASERGAIGEGPKKPIEPEPPLKISEEPYSGIGVNPKHIGESNLPGETVTLTKRKLVENEPPELTRLAEEMGGIKNFKEGRHFENVSEDFYVSGTDRMKAIIRAAHDKALEAGMVQKATRGHVTHEQTIKEAEEFLSSGKVTVESILSMPPGYTATAGEALAMRTVRNSVGEYIDPIAIKSIKGDVEADKDFQKGFALLGEIQSRIEGPQAEAARTTESFKIEPLSGKQLDEVALKELLDEAYSKGTFTITGKELAEKYLKLDSHKRPTFARQVINGLKVGENMFLEAFVAGLVSAPPSQVANVLGDLGAVFNTLMERRIAGVYGLRHYVTGSKDYVAFLEAEAGAYGLISGLAEAFRVAGKSLKTGEPQFGGQKIPIREPAISGAAVGIGGNIGKAIDYFGGFVRSPFRGLLTMDEFFKSINFSFEKYAEVYREAAKSGKPWNEMKADMAKLLDDLPGRIKRNAEDLAITNTFQKELGPITEAVMKIRAERPMSKLVAPFVQIAGNIGMYSAERTPIINLAIKSHQADLAAGGARRDLALAKVTFGGLTMAMVMNYAAAGYITGEGPRDRNLRRDMISNGWQPYSVRIGDYMVGFGRLDPLGQIVGMAANTAEIIGHLRDPDTLNVLIAGALAFTRTIFSKNYLMGISDLLDAIHDPNQSIETYTKNFARGLLPNVLARYTQQVDDPVIRETNGIIDVLRSRVPGYSDDLSPSRDLSGKIRLVPAGFDDDTISSIWNFFIPLSISKRRNDPVFNEIERNQISISRPSKILGGTPPPKGLLEYEERLSFGVEMTPHQYDDYVRLAGNELKEGGMGCWDTLTELVKSEEYKQAADGPDTIDNSKAKMIKNVIGYYRKLAREEILEKYDDLREKVEKLKEKREKVSEGTLSLSISGRPLQ